MSGNSGHLRTVITIQHVTRDETEPKRGVSILPAIYGRAADEGKVMIRFGLYIHTECKICLLKIYDFGHATTIAQPVLTPTKRL